MICDLYISGEGWVSRNITVIDKVDVKPKLYEVWQDEEGEKYWVIMGQNLGDAIDCQRIDEIDCQKIIEYSQQDNWVVECFKIENGCCVTKYYDKYYPVILSNNCKRIHGDIINIRRNDHLLYFAGKGSKCSARVEFHAEAIRQHELFSDATGCYFRDIQPNNFLADRDFGDPKIIDICSIVPGHIKRDYRDPFVGCEHTWPLPDSRTVGYHP